MLLDVTVLLRDDIELPPAAVCRVEVTIADRERRRLNVWAHLSMDGGDRIRVGDYVTAIAYPIPSGGETHRIAVELRRVGPAPAPPA